MDYGVIGYPRSGNNWLCYCIHTLSAIRLPINAYAHGNDLNFWKQPFKGNIFFIIRNYKECVVRHSKYILSRMFNNINGKRSIDVGYDKTDYIGLLNFYDTYPKENKVLIYYEELILNPKKVFNDILTFTGDTNKELKISNFMNNYEKHRRTSLNSYASNIQTPVSHNNIKYHSKKISKEDRLKMDMYIKNNFSNLFYKYLKGYAEE